MGDEIALSLPAGALVAGRSYRFALTVSADSRSAVVQADVEVKVTTPPRVSIMTVRVGKVNAPARVRPQGHSKVPRGLPRRAVAAAGTSRRRAAHNPHSRQFLCSSKLRAQHRQVLGSATSQLTAHLGEHSIPVAADE